MYTGNSIDYGGNKGPVNIAGLTSNDYENSTNQTSYTPKIPLDNSEWVSSVAIIDKINSLQATIEAEKMCSYTTNIGTNTSGSISPETHGLSSNFPIHFSCKYLVDELWNDVMINHNLSPTSYVSWSVLKAFTSEQQAKVELVGKKGLPTKTERELMNEYAYGIQWKPTVIGLSEPKRVGNMSLHASLPIQSQMRGCVWNIDKGIMYYLNPDNWAYTSDGEQAVLTGNDGDVCVHIPKFYGRCVVEDNNREVWISEYKISSDWVEIPAMVIGAFKGILVNGKWRSIIAPELNGGNGTTDYDTKHWSASTLGKPSTYINRISMRVACRANGMELLCYEYYKWIMYWLPIIEYCNFNSQDSFTEELTPEGFKKGMLGRGMCGLTQSSWTTWNNMNPIIPNGFGIGEYLSQRTKLPLHTKFNNIHKGNKSFTYTISDADLGFTTANPDRQTISSYRGISVPFGDIWSILDGVLASGNNIYTTTDVDSFVKLDSDTNGGKLAGVLLPSNGKLGVHYADNGTQKIELWASVLGGSYDMFNTLASGNRILCIGGSNNTTSGSSLGNFMVRYLPSGSAFTYVSGRSYQLL
ncbi:MAG: hypothetical protein IJ180_07545 [Bacteroidales bacterium]|nr:hypothetical protein [Bacteroidales bacterium]